MSNSWTGREDKVGLIKALLPITHKRWPWAQWEWREGCACSHPSPQHPPSTHRDPQNPASTHRDPQHPPSPETTRAAGPPCSAQGCEDTGAVGRGRVPELTGTRGFGVLPELSLALPSTAPAWQESPGTHGGTLWVKSPYPMWEDPAWVLLT